MSDIESTLNTWEEDGDIWTNLTVQASCANCGFKKRFQNAYIFKSNDPKANLPLSKTLAQEMAQDELIRNHDAENSWCNGSLQFTVLN